MIIPILLCTVSCHHLPESLTVSFMERMHFRRRKKWQSILTHWLWKQSVTYAFCWHRLLEFSCWCLDTELFNKRPGNQRAILGSHMEPPWLHSLWRCLSQTDLALTKLDAKCVCLIQLPVTLLRGLLRRKTKQPEMNRLQDLKKQVEYKGFVFYFWMYYILILQCCIETTAVSFPSNMELEAFFYSQTHINPKCSAIKTCCPKFLLHPIL